MKVYKVCSSFPMCYHVTCAVTKEAIAVRPKPEFTRQQALELAIQHNVYWDSPSDITLLVAEQFYNYLNEIEDDEG